MLLKTTLALTLVSDKSVFVFKVDEWTFLAFPAWAWILTLFALDAFQIVAVLNHNLLVWTFTISTRASNAL
jgi:hypothetical protein